MKKTLFLLIAFLTFSDIMAQTKEDFYGEWKIGMLTEETWSMKKNNENVLDYVDWGRFFHFKEDGTYTEYASAPCGLDDNHYCYSGKWSFDASTGIISLYNIKVLSKRPEIYNNYKVLSSGKLLVTSWKEGIMNLKMIRNWEKVTERR